MKTLITAAALALTTTAALADADWTAHEELSYGFGAVQALERYCEGWEGLRAVTSRGDAINDAFRAAGVLPVYDVETLGIIDGRNAIVALGCEGAIALFQQS